MKTEEQLRWERRLRLIWLVLAVFYTIPAIISLFPVQHLGWLDVPRTWEAGISLWGVATFFWLLYITRLRLRRQASPVAILFAMSPIFMLHYISFLWGGVLFWCISAIIVVHHFARPRRRTAALTAAISMTALPILFLVYAKLTGTPDILSRAQASFWAIAAVMWAQYFRLRRKTTAEEEECWSEGESRRHRL